MSIPATHEDHQFTRVLARNTPSDAMHARYLTACRSYRARHRHSPQSMSADGTVTRIESLRTYESQLFGREYLVAYVSAEWLARAAPDCDAVASISIGPAAPPALVMMPASAHSKTDDITTSILEHEIVHVNQALLAIFPDKHWHEGIPDAVSAFFSIVRGEYDANRLQLARWPQLRPPSGQLDLDYWCVLRGWVDALEFAVGGALCRPDAIPAVLDAIPNRVPAEFEALAVDPALGPEFIGDLRGHVEEATKVIVERGAGEHCAGIAHARRWVAGRSA